ncbi:MAG: cytochrome oxidase subunit III [Rhodopirellula sp.]|nr:cytochrome oxidase subunit III [Rhodopirellula sp.]OUX51204.1 MAG: cytochrome oxidase subunit III [Rhodopirellula sp. TMED283]
MSTIEASPEVGHDEHGHDHDHPPFLAHHFDTPEQQFDSGKLGIWLFLVTEVLFFSGMFCAYAIFRALRPEVFEGCSQFLNTKLGAINTGVLLFSSLTMAWAVRCSQLEQHKGLVGTLAATLSCAMIFLGVKAIEYSHKFGMGLLPAGLFFYDPSNPHPTEHPPYLAYICAPFALALAGVLIWLVVSAVSGNKFQFAIAKPLSVVCLCFFVGVGLGTVLESGEESADHIDVHADPNGLATAPVMEQAEKTMAAEAAPAIAASGAMVAVDETVLKILAKDPANVGVVSSQNALEQQTAAAGTSTVTGDGEILGAITTTEVDVMTPTTAGVFFSIYYCMTGIHAIHILAGIGVLVWLLVRAVRQDFNRQYFGPVDYVGLYWHLVDLIWIYLFPLLYLIR